MSVAFVLCKGKWNGHNWDIGPETRRSGATNQDTDTLTSLFHISNTYVRIDTYVSYIHVQANLPVRMYIHTKTAIWLAMAYDVPDIRLPQPSLTYYLERTTGAAIALIRFDYWHIVGIFTSTFICSITYFFDYQLWLS